MKGIVRTRATEPEGREPSNTVRIDCSSLNLHKDSLVRINFAIWSHSVEQVYLGCNHNKSQKFERITCLSSREGRVGKGIFCLHLISTFVHNLRNFVRNLSLLYQS